MTARRYDAFSSEAALVAMTRDWLQVDGWSCFFEVAPWGAGASRADIVATKGPLLAVIECKLSLSLALLEQCEAWLKYAHVIWGATPFLNGGAFAGKVAKEWGFGLVELGQRWGRANSQITVQPRLRRRVEHERIRRHLGDAQANHKPGSNHSFATPYTATVAALLGIVTEAKRIAVKDAIAQVRHHYSSSACARQTLMRDVEIGRIKGLRLAREGRTVFFEAAT